MAFGNLGFESAGTVQGLADLWTPAEVGLARIASYGDGNQPAAAEPPFESFRGGWLSNEDFKTAFAGVPTDLEAAIYDTGPGLAPESIEDFEEGWGNGIFEFVSGANASYDGRAFVEAANPETYALGVGDTLSLTTDTGGPASSTPVAATRAVNTGAAGTYGTGFEGANRIRLTVDDGPLTVIDLGAAQTLAAIIGLINASFIDAVAVDAAGELEFRSPTEGSVSRIFAEEIQAARIVATNPAPYALADGQTLLVDIDGAGVQVVTFNTAEFGNIAAATAFEVAQAILADLGPGIADGLFGIVRIVSETTTGSTVEVTGGTAAAVFGFPAGPQNAPLARLGITPGDTVGGGNVRNLTTVTADEIADLVNGAVAIQAINAEVRAAAGVPRAYSTVPATGTIAVNASAIQTAVDFTPTTAGPSGIAAGTEEDFEEEWSGNEAYFRSAADITLTAALFDTALESVEDFEEEWSGNESFIFDDTGAGYTAAFYSPDPATPFVQVEDFNFVLFDRAFSADPSTDICTAIAHVLLTTLTVRSEGGQLPEPLLENTEYFPTVLGVDTFRLRESIAGPNIDLTTAGTGTLIFKYSELAYWTEDLGI